MNEVLSKELDALQARMFYMNKKSDRIASLLKNKFYCVSFSEIFHNDYAHFWALKAADKIVEMKDLAGVESLYPAVEASTEDFTTLADMFEFLYGITIETKEAVQQTIEVAERFHEITIKVALEDFLVRLQKVIYSAYFLNKKSIQYDENIFLFDVQAPAWYVRIFDAM